MIQTLIATAGVSVFSGQNLGRTWAEAHASDLLSFQGRSPVPQLAPGVDADQVLERWRQGRPQLEDERRISAEYSALHALSLAEGARVVLLHSDTVAGVLAAHLVADVISARTRCHVQRIQITDLDPDRPHGVRAAIADFVRKLSDALAQGEPSTTAFAPIGGFKVMTALGYLVGAYHGYPSIYLHEGKQLVHRVPPVPVRVDEDELRPVADLVRRTRHGAEVTDAAELRAIDARPWLFERDGDLVFLNAFGELLRADPRYQPIVQTRVRIADPRALRGQEAVVRREVRDLLQELESPHANRASLDHAPNFGHHDAAFCLYRGSRHGTVTFSASYAYDEAHDVLDLRKVWFDHARYEREAGAGTGLDAYDGPWTDVSDVIWAEVAP